METVKTIEQHEQHARKPRSHQNKCRTATSHIHVAEPLDRKDADRGDAGRERERSILILKIHIRDKHIEQEHRRPAERTDDASVYHDIQQFFMVSDLMVNGIRRSDHERARQFQPRFGTDKRQRDQNRKPDPLQNGPIPIFPRLNGRIVHERHDDIDQP